MSVDIRDPRLPISDDAEIDHVAKRTARQLSNLVLGDGDEDVVTLAYAVLALLNPLTDKQLEDVQAIGEAIAAFASQAREMQAGPTP